MHNRISQQVLPPSAGVDIGVRFPDDPLGDGNGDAPLMLSPGSMGSVWEGGWLVLDAGEEDRDRRLGREWGWRM